MILVPPQQKSVLGYLAPLLKYHSELKSSTNLAANATKTYQRFTSTPRLVFFSATSSRLVVNGQVLISYDQWWVIHSNTKSYRSL